MQVVVGELLLAEGNLDAAMHSGRLQTCQPMLEDALHDRFMKRAARVMCGRSVITGYESAHDLEVLAVSMR